MNITKARKESDPLKLIIVSSSTWGWDINSCHLQEQFSIRPGEPSLQPHQRKALSTQPLPHRVPFTPVVRPVLKVIDDVCVHTCTNALLNCPQRLTFPRLDFHQGCIYPSICQVLNTFLFVCALEFNSGPLRLF